MDRKQLAINIAFGLSFLIILFGFPTLVSSHGHSHDGHEHAHSHGHHGHSHDEAPSFKYSRDANVLAAGQLEEEARLVQQEFQAHQRSSTGRRTSEELTSLWVNAIGSTLLVSAAPFFILFLIPLDNTEASQPLLKVLLSFAAGGLLGDALLHLIPHALMAAGEAGEGGQHSHSHSHESHGHSHGEGGGHAHDMTVGLWVLSGIVAFLMVEKFVRIVKGGHGHSHGPAPVQTESEKSEDSAAKPSGSSEKKKKEKVSDDEEEVEKDVSEENKKEKKSSKTDKKEKSPKQTKSKDAKGKPVKTKDVAVTAPKSDIKVAGYLNLAADFTHNLTDGLAIGASYLAGHSIGVVTTITIVLHEVPHEIGDFAILVQSGVPRRKAIMLQLVTAVGALTGTVISLLAEGADAAATSRILPFTAGGFIYIACVSVIPELLEKTSFWQSVKELVALFVGIYMMVLIAEYE